jgi:hypothetical protein
VTRQAVTLGASRAMRRKRLREGAAKGMDGLNGAEGGVSPAARPNSFQVRPSSEPETTTLQPPVRGAAGGAAAAPRPPLPAAALPALSSRRSISSGPGPPVSWY